jgi:hypothetical protein
MNATMLLSKSQAVAISNHFGVKAPKKPNQRVVINGANLWYMPASFRKKTGIGKGKVFRVSAKDRESITEFLPIANENGRGAVICYKKD